MSIANGLISGLKISDVLTFLTVQRCGSISSAARELMVTPSQVSKTISRLEDLLGASLFSRSASGIALLEQGERLVPEFEQILELARALQKPAASSARVLSFAAPSYLASYFMPLIAASGAAFRIRVLELPPAQIRAHMATGHFDVALGLGDVPEAAAWESHVAGEIEKALFASPAMAARFGGRPIKRTDLAQLPIISPLYITDTGFLPVDDACPITRRDRFVGHETTTFALALAIAARTDQLVFGPVVGALPFLEAGVLVKLSVEGWALRDTVKVVYATDRITRSEQRAVVSAVERGIASIAF